MTGKNIPLYMESADSYTDQDKKMFVAGLEYGIVIDHLLHGALLENFPIQKENVRRIYKVVNETFENLQVSFKTKQPKEFDDPDGYFNGLDLVFLTISEKV